VNMTLTYNKLDCLSPMGKKTIPYQNHMLSQVSFEGSEEIGNTGSVDIGVRMKTKKQMDAVSCRGNAEGCDHRNLSMRPGAVVQDGCLSSGCPAPADERCHQQAALIDENQNGLQA